jgi:hypothetical protein
LITIIISILILIGALYLLFYLWEVIDDYSAHYCEFFWMYPTKIIMVVTYLVLIGALLYINTGGKSLC